MSKTKKAAAKRTPTEAPAERLARIHSQVGELFAGPVIPDLLELEMATAISSRVVPHGPPVWLLCEGPPSRGKTAAVDLLKATADGAERLTVFAPKITLGSLTSGFKDTKTGRRAPALLKEFDGRCWCNTEFSTLLTGDSKSVAPILGVLTAAFDGDLRAAFGNVTENQDSPILELKSRFSLLGCITPQVRQQHARLLSQLGPRFLSYRLPLTDEEQTDAFRLMREPRRAAQLKDLQALVKIHMLDTLKETSPVNVPDEADAVLQVLAKLVAAGRTPVSFREGVPIVEDAEDPLRVYQQLRALLIALTRIQGTSKPSPRALRLVRDVALSSFEPQRAEALTVQRTSPVLALSRFQDGEPPAWLHGLTVSRLQDETGWSNDTAARVIDELVALGLYVADKESAVVDTAPSGRRPMLYVPVPGLLRVLNATFEDYPPRLVSAMELFTSNPESFDGRLSPPDARLAAAVWERQAERFRELAREAERLHEQRPDLPPEHVSLLAIQRATGAKWLPNEEMPVDA